MSDIVGTLIHGCVVTSTTAEALPSAEADWVIIKANSGNTTSVYVGNANVTDILADGLLCGFELEPGEVTPKIKLKGNLDQIYVLAESLTPAVTFIAQR
jgi:hypothetical protein